MNKLQRFFLIFAVFGAMLCLRPDHTLANESEKLPTARVRADISSQELSDRILTAYNKINDLSVETHLDFKLIKQGLDFDATGEYLYKQPDKTTLVLHSFMASRVATEEAAIKATNILAALRKNITNEYNAGPVTETTLDGQRCYTVELTPKTKENLSKIVIWIDADKYTMPQVMMQYLDGSNLTQRKEYELLNDVYVVREMDTDYVSPKNELQLHATFGKYLINRGIPDSTFENQTPSNLISPF